MRKRLFHILKISYNKHRFSLHWRKSIKCEWLFWRNLTRFHNIPATPTASLARDHRLPNSSAPPSKLSETGSTPPVRLVDRWPCRCRWLGEGGSELHDGVHHLAIICFCFCFYFCFCFWWTSACGLRYPLPSTLATGEGRPKEATIPPCRMIDARLNDSVSV